MSLVHEDNLQHYNNKPEFQILFLSSCVLHKSGPKYATGIKK